VAVPFTFFGNFELILNYLYGSLQERIQDFKLGGAHLKKLRRAEGGAKNVGVFRVKNNDFMPKNLISSNYGGRREIFWLYILDKAE
jgi:hypothetical protein